MQAQAVRIHKTGGADALSVDEVSLAKPGKDELLLKHTAIGVNFIDTYHRSGLYKLPSYPAILGLEAAGTVEEVGEGVSAFKPGDRVAYCGGPVGAYASHRVIATKQLVKIPANVSDETAAAAMLKGMTAQFILRHTFHLEKGQTVLIHAAAGGVGLIACQWAKHLGAIVIGTVSSKEKAELAKQNGCDHPIIYTEENFAKKARELTQGRGVDVVYDSVGKDTFMDSLDCLKKFGMMVSFGNASGPVPAIEPLLLSQKGSLYLTRPTLMHHIEDPQEYAANAKELFDLIAKGILNIRISKTYPLSEAQQAHRDLEGRKTTGAVILVP